MHEESVVSLLRLVHLPTPQINSCLALKQKHIVGVQGGGQRWNLKGFSVGLVRAADLEKPYWRLRIRASISGCATLKQQKSTEHHGWH